MAFCVAVKILILATLLGVGPRVECLNFNFTEFDDSTRDQLILSGDSNMFSGAIQITPDVNGEPTTNKSGRVLYRKPYRLWSKGYNASFNSTFVLNIQAQTSPGGEGLAFILTGSSVVDITPMDNGLQDDYNSKIVHWVWDLYSKGRILSAADSRLNGDFATEDMERALILGLACCHPNPHNRPSMKIVLQVLKGEAAPPPVPNEMPVFMWPPLPPSFKELDISHGQTTPFTNKWEIGNSN
ncbi:hypothetical protein GH714_036676 [Hevea brasiliensis]|uniref:Legume lectin domain-containing protein n=1 Tax=Hevea brasiliensis TaxID=3981 RepID=A0A6A6KPY4_HEVBR|nr:hypothetical protein GH714_036676 [Hevea brasiliensis]